MVPPLQANNSEIVERISKDMWPQTAFSYFVFYDAIKAALINAAWCTDDDSCVTSLIGQAKLRNKDTFQNLLSQNARFRDLQDLSTKPHGTCTVWCTLIDKKVNDESAVYFYYGRVKNLFHTVAWSHDMALIDSSRRTTVHLSKNFGKANLYTRVQERGEPPQLKECTRTTKYEALLESLLHVSMSNEWIILFRSVKNRIYGFNGRIVWYLADPMIELSELDKETKKFKRKRFIFKKKPDTAKVKTILLYKASIRAFTDNEDRKTQWQEVAVTFWKIWSALSRIYDLPEYEEKLE